jgi:hypothetical protein
VDLLRVCVHYDFYTKDRGDASSSEYRGGPGSNGIYSLVFIHSTVFFKHGHFKKGVTLLSFFKWATFNRANGSSGICMQFYPALPMLQALSWITQLNQPKIAILK